MNIIFLDRDETLISLRYIEKLYHENNGDCMSEMLDPECVDNVKKIINATNAGIVLTTHSSISTTMEEFKAEYNGIGYGLGEYIIGKTPKIIGCKYRGIEIQQWLDLFGHKYENFVILDDDNDMAHLKPYLIQVNPYFGVTSQDADRAIKLINRQSKDLREVSSMIEGHYKQLKER